MNELAIRNGIARYLRVDGTCAVYVRNHGVLSAFSEEDLPEPWRTAAVRPAIAELSEAVQARADEYPTLAWLIDAPYYFVVSPDGGTIQENGWSQREWAAICSRLRRYQRFTALEQAPLFRAPRANDHAVPTIERVAPTIDHLDPMIASTDLTIEPVDLTIEPIDLTIEPVEPTIEPIDPTIEPIDPMVEPIDPTVDHADPTIDHVVPTIELIDPAIDHADPTIELAAPAVAPEIAAPEPAAPAAQLKVVSPVLTEPDFLLSMTTVCEHLHHIRDFLLPDRRVFLDRQTGTLVSVFEGYADTPVVSSEHNLKMLREIPKATGRYLEIPIPEYSQWHSWFSQFVQSIGRWHDRLGDIAGWVRSIATDEERVAWEQFGRDRLAEYVEQVATDAGLVVRVEADATEA